MRAETEHTKYRKPKKTKPNIYTYTTIGNRVGAGMVGNWAVDDVVVRGGVAEAEVEELPPVQVTSNALFRVDGFKMVRVRMVRSFSKMGRRALSTLTRSPSPH